MYYTGWQKLGKNMLLGHKLFYISVIEASVLEAKYMLEEITLVLTC